ncbi:creatinine amidohydrolase [Jatrophihabitans endophyticus]|uniref:Creatinine amidohydrolase n=1 Tax=Jatrophihabitans endophyticus TaxID=1206085 RepID=A0A1M5Q205_9ACTN|nr:mycofactocin biosynthesis peptidyl-dipeptidase MftE [Jatrophihabitans endophyticus]SHH07980.1 creatinine amidohydrolase [Jatrophihabitans endophyticus]
MTATLLGDLTWPQVRERAAAGSILAVPLGATEQHGPHLPLSTDTDVAGTLCAALGAARPAVVVAPAVPYGSSGEHDGFAGTLSLGQDALEHLLVELGRSASLTFGRLLFVSGHGGNAAPLTRAVTLLRAEGRVVQAWSPTGYVDAHAGRTETSLQLALDARRVDLASARPGDTRPIAEVLPLLRAGGVRAVSANGVLGDPTGASAQEGAATLAGLERALVAFVDRVFAPDARPRATDPSGSRDDPIHTSGRAG